MMKKPLGVILFIISGLLVAMWFLFIGFSSPNGGFSLVVGFSWLIILGLALFNLKNWARIAAMVLSVGVLLVCTAFFVAAVTGDPLYGIVTVIYAPGILPGILALFLTKKRKEGTGS